MTGRVVRRRALARFPTWARDVMVRESNDPAKVLAEQLHDSSWADLPDHSVRRALDAATSDLRGKIHTEELERMVAQLALFRLAAQRAALQKLIR